MKERGAYGQRLGDVFQLGRTPAFVTRTLRKTELAVTHIRCDLANNGLSAPIPREDAFLVTLQLRDCPRHDLWVDDQAMRTGHLKAGAVSIYDLRLNPIANSISPFQALHFYLPHAALDTIADMEDCTHVDSFDNNPGLGVDDPIIHGLSLALLPSFEQPAEANRLFVDHITMAAAAHTLCTHGVGAKSRRPLTESLARWRERRVKDILAAHLDGDVSLSYLAQECGLPISAFCRAFRHTTGMAPHQWLLAHRIDKARALLRSQPHASVHDIALACGFASEAHLVRTFKRLTGSHPENWRRA